MLLDTQIGRVISVDTAHIVIKLDRDQASMSRTTAEGTHEVGRINSYVILPVGVVRLVGMVTRVSIVDDPERGADSRMVTLPSSHRLMRVTLVGTIEDSSFYPGVSRFPVLDNPVHLVQRTDLDAIFGPNKHDPTMTVDLDNPGYCIPIGETVVVGRRPVRIDPDVFFGKHAAILGGTGSGKSCTIASLLQSIRSQQNIRRTTCIVLDTNGEYRRAFQKETIDNSDETTTTNGVLYLSPGTADASDRLTIPYWFMDTDDFVHIFRAAGSVQRPVLLEALRLARNDSVGASASSAVRHNLVREFNRLWSWSERDDKTSKSVKVIAKGLLDYLTEEDIIDAWSNLETTIGLTIENMKSALNVVCRVANTYTDSGKYPGLLPISAQEEIRNVLRPICKKLTELYLGNNAQAVERSADAPSYFDKKRFRSRHIEQVLRREESGGARARDYSGTMLLRIDRLLADRRFEFLFGKTGEALPEPAHALATFLRDILGIGPSEESMLSDESDVPKSSMPFYDRQRAGEAPIDIVILDLSLLAAEVLENVTALIGRLVLEFLQRLGEYGGENARGSLPVVLVLEEAQNYIRRRRSNEDESLSRVVFERIAREGRKYGLGLVIASQRPSELSTTVLSQCNSYIVHRLQNPEDLRYFREIVPSIFGPMLEQIPALAPRTALVLGECVPVPALIRVREARPLPRSDDPRFYRYWVEDEVPDVDVEAICSRWESGSS